MKVKTEARILKSYLEMTGKPDVQEKAYRRGAMVLFVTAIVGVMYLYSDNIKGEKPDDVLVALTFLCGLFVGIGIWFSQMASQTKLFMQHLSQDSISRRIEEIENETGI